MAHYKINNVWIKGNKLKTSIKIKLYKSLVKPIYSILYNCGIWALTLTEEERLNAYQRKQLKKILKIRYPKKITNKSLYRTCPEKPRHYKSYRLAGVSLAGSAVAQSVERAIPAEEVHGSITAVAARPLLGVSII